MEAKKAEVTREEVNKKSVMRERDELLNHKTDLEAKLKHAALNLSKTNEQLRETVAENQGFKMRKAELEAQLKSQTEDMTKLKGEKVQLQEQVEKISVTLHSEQECLKVRNAN